MNKLLLLGGVFLQNFVIRKAKSMGYYVLCLVADHNALGFQIADEHAVINIAMKKQVWHMLAKKQPNLSSGLQGSKP